MFRNWGLFLKIMVYPSNVKWDVAEKISKNVEEALKSGHQ